MRNRYSNIESGFTLIELLVVIAIIGILAGIVLASLASSRISAERAREKSELVQIVKVLNYAKVASGETLNQITGSGYSMSTCVGAGDLRNTTGTCYTAWASALNKIQAITAGVYDHLDNFYRDQWGSPYLLDENEGEFPATYCRQDTVRSAGPDGIYNTGDDVNSPVLIPYLSPNC